MSEDRIEVERLSVDLLAVMFVRFFSLLSCILDLASSSFIGVTQCSLVLKLEETLIRVQMSSGKPNENVEKAKLILKSSIRSLVNSTNCFLGSLEDTTHTTKEFAASRLRPVLNQMKHGLEKGIVLYEQREYYGPQIIGATTASVASMVAIRRGKVPASLVGGVTAAVMYSVVYGLPKQV
jgi:hypothetical protein